MIIDCHQHVGSLRSFMPSSIPRLGGEDPMVADAAARIEFMARIGVDRAIVMPAFEYSVVNGDADIRRLNDTTAQYVKENDFAVGGFAIVDPFATADPVAETHRAVEELGLFGVAWHGRFQRVPSDSDLVRNVIRHAPASTKVFVIHCVAESSLEAPSRLARLAEEFPDRTFLALSSLSSHSQCEEMIRLAARHENVLLDTSSLIPLGLWLERLVHAVGSSRLLYGTDLYLNPPMFRQNYPLNALHEADITDADRTAILHDNAVRVFGLDDLT
jgi:predicted TIM-barrel fold metal-dependent hydrolase